jgi:DNA-binding MarR family transcriptional regulator
MEHVNPDVPLARLFSMAFNQLIDGLHDRLVERGWSGVRRSYGFVLLAVRRTPITATELTQLLAISKQATSQLLDAMERDGLIERAADTTDARAKFVHITPMGQELLADVEAIYGELESEWKLLIGATQVAAIRRDLTSVLLQSNDGTLPPVRPT